MSGLFSELLDLSFISVLYRIVLTAFIGGFIGYERERHGRAAGLRTHLLVAIGSTLVTMVGLYCANLVEGVDATRIAAGVISGIGFLCAGTILIKNGDMVLGLTTAATVWVTSAIGIAIGFGFYDAAIVTAIIAIVSVEFLNKFEKSKNDSTRFYLEVNNSKKVNYVIDKLQQIDKIGKISYVGAPKSNINGNVGIYLMTNIKVTKNDGIKVKEMIDIISNIDNVDFVIREQ